MTSGSSCAFVDEKQRGVRAYKFLCLFDFAGDQKTLREKGLLPKSFRKEVLSVQYLHARELIRHLVLAELREPLRILRNSPKNVCLLLRRNVKALVQEQTAQVLGFGFVEKHFHLK